MRTKKLLLPRFSFNTHQMRMTFKNFAIYLFIFGTLSFQIFHSQEKNDSTKKIKMEWFGFLELYTAYANQSFDPIWPSSFIDEDYIHPGFVSHNRRKGINVNYALVQGSMEYDRFKVNLGIHTGIYVRDNYQNEPLGLLSEANLTVNLHKRKPISLQLGIMPSHIGFENAISMNNWTLTRSVLADNSPYYMCGAKLNFNHKKWLFSAMVLNGWQAIMPSYYSNFAPLGWQILREGEKLTFQSSGYLDILPRQSFHPNIWFQNFFLNWKINRNNGLIFGLDVGQSSNAQYIGNNAQFFGGTALIYRHDWSDKWSSAHRLEAYSGNEFSMNQVKENDRTMLGGSSNIDFKFSQNLWFRLDMRYLHFVKYSDTVNLLQVTVSAAVKLN
jgi:hypothetical protein